MINKIDLAGGAGYRAAFQAACGLDATYLTSAVTGEGLPELTEAVVAVLPEGQPFFAPDQLTDVYEREIAADLIREAALSLLHQELPHAIAVKVEEWTERPNGMLYLRAQLVVERDSQKGIVIGKGGRMLKTIGASARSKIEGWIQRRVYLDVNVRVLEHWRRDERALRWLGLMRE